MNEKKSVNSAVDRPPIPEVPWVDQLQLRTLDLDRQARVALASIPLPQDDHAFVAFKDIPSQSLPIAWYPADHGGRLGKPRQVLVMGLADGNVPDELALAEAHGALVVDPQAPSAAPTSEPSWPGPRWRSTIVEEKKTGVLMREVNELVLEYAGRRLGFRLGIELATGGFHWWEWLQIERLWTGPVCTAIRAGGYIGVTDIAEDEMFAPGQYNAGYWLHRHNWLFAEVYAQIFTNGLVRVTARHVNNRFFDQGRDLEGFVPVIAFHAPEANLPDTPLDGSRTDFTLGAGSTGVQLDIDRGADLISPQHPGRIRSESEAALVIYQPYEGAELLLGDGQPTHRWKVEAGERRLWKGMARSIGFDLSFADQPIRTRRYLPPYGWQGYTGALWPDAVLPARGPLEVRCDQLIERSEGSPPLGPKPFCSGRYFQTSATLDGEAAHGLMRQAYRTARRDLYEAALHHAYAFADIGLDHADFTQQIIGMPKGSISLVLQRNLGLLAAYLETGDPYLLHCAESLADTAYAIDRSNWPRRSFGRDSAYIRSLTRLYDVTGQPFYLQRAGEACRRAAQCQRPDGSFADQGGTFGTHAHLNEIIKPWMNSILAEVLVDYLERAGSDPAVETCLVRVADWLLSVQQEDEDGKYWPYQVAWGRNVYDPTGKWSPDQPARQHPVGEIHLDYNARTLLWVSRHTGDPRHAQAWRATYQRQGVKIEKTGGAYGGAYGNVKVPDNFPWHEAHLWGARWDGRGVSFEPFLDLLEVGREATIELPYGQTVRVRRTEQGVETV